MKEKTDGYWHWFEGTRKGMVRGKYLLFSCEKQILEEIARREIKDKIPVAKISMKADEKDHVLCLYYYDDSLNSDMRTKYSDMDGVKYRNWKYDLYTQLNIYYDQRTRLIEQLHSCIDKGFVYLFKEDEWPRSDKMRGGSYSRIGLQGRIKDNFEDFFSVQVPANRYLIIWKEKNRSISLILDGNNRSIKSLMNSNDIDLA